MHRTVSLAPSDSLPHPRPWEMNVFLPLSWMSLRLRCGRALSLRRGGTQPFPATLGAPHLIKHPVSPDPTSVLLPSCLGAACVHSP